MSEPLHSDPFSVEPANDGGLPFVYRLPNNVISGKITVLRDYGAGNEVFVELEDKPGFMTRPAARQLVREAFVDSKPPRALEIRTAAYRRLWADFQAGELIWALED